MLAPTASMKKSPLLKGRTDPVFDLLGQSPHLHPLIKGITLHFTSGYEHPYAMAMVGSRGRCSIGSCSRTIFSPLQSVPNTFFARLVAAAAGFLRMVSSCLPIISNNPLRACSVT